MPLGHVVEVQTGQTDACCDDCIERAPVISLASIHEGDVDEDAPPLCLSCGEEIK